MSKVDLQRHLAEMYQMPGHKLRRVNQIIVAKFYSKCAGTDITPVQFSAMTAIAAEGEIDATRLSQMIAFDRSTLGAVIDRLEKRGAIKRSPHPSDRRIKILSLTDTGHEILEEVRPLVKSSQEDFLNMLDPKEREDLQRILQKIIDLSK